MFASGQLKDGEMYDVDHSRTGWGDYLKHKRKSPVNRKIYRTLLAEREGFEPPVPLSTPVFKTGAFDHSAISPKGVGWSRQISETLKQRLNL